MGASQMPRGRGRGAELILFCWGAQIPTEHAKNSRSNSASPVETTSKFIRRTQEGCDGLGRENSAAFPKARPIFQQPFSLPENAQTLAGIAFRAAGKSGKNFPAASKFARKLFQQRISDSHGLLEFSEFKVFSEGCLQKEVPNIGRRTEQAKAKFDPRVRPRVAPRVRPREPPREHPRGLISLFSALQGLPMKVSTKGPTSGRSGFTCSVFTCSVL